MGASLKKQAVIFGSAPGNDWSFLKNYLRSDAAIICADGGRNTAEGLGLTLDWYVGDDDSGGHAGNCPADLLPSEKDVTDLDMAVSRALKEGYQELLLCGCTGGRQDHHFSAVGQLERIWRAGADGMILDPWNEIRLLTPGRTEVPHHPHYHYFGIVPLDQTLERVTITGAKYEIQQVNLYRWESLGISNECMPGQPCMIEVESGIGLLIRSN